MKKRVVVVHGKGSSPTDGWFPWLKHELESRGFEVLVPSMPDAYHPDRDFWVGTLTELLGTAHAETYFVGHSMGCQAILRYLESLPEGSHVGGAVFVGGFFEHISGERNGVPIREYYASWFRDALDAPKIRARLSKSVAVFSDNDPYIELANQEDYRNKLGSEIIIEHNKGHFRGTGDNIKDIPVVLEKILEISK